MKVKLTLLIFTLLSFLTFSIGCTEDNDYINSLDFPSNFFDDTDRDSTYAFAPESETEEFEFAIESTDEVMDDSEINYNDSLSERTSADEVSQVWIPGSGAKYHSKPDCSNMKSPTQVEIAEAVAQGFEPCKRCF